MDHPQDLAPIMPLRAVLHAHSTWSYDGHWSLSAIARIYGAMGVRAVMMSEHDTGFDPGSFAAYRAACAAASTARCTLIPGIEYSSPDNDIHILTWGMSRFLAEHRPVAETLGGVRDAGGVAVFAHPVRRAAWQQFDIAWVPYLAGVELWNRKSDGISWGIEALTLIRDTGLPATVGQDFHRLRQIWPLTQAFDLADEPKPLEQALVAALHDGHTMPLAFRRPFLDSAGLPRHGLYPKLERLRLQARDGVRGKWAKP